MSMEAEQPDPVAAFVAKTTTARMAIVLAECFPPTSPGHVRGYAGRCSTGALSVGERSKQRAAPLPFSRPDGVESGAP